MKNFTIDTTPFVTEYVDALEKVFSRMGWMPERDSDTFTIAVPEEDISLAKFIFDFEYFL